MVDDPVVGELLFWVVGRTSHYHFIELVRVTEIFRHGHIRVESKAPTPSTVEVGNDFIARRRDLFRHRDDAELFATCRLLGCES